MSSLVNQPFQNIFGDMLTTTNSGLGLSTTLKPLQDGFGNSSSIQIATNAVNFIRTGATFQLDSIALTASATNINNICSSTPNYSGITTAIQLPNLADDPGAPEPGMIYYNTNLATFRAYIQGTGWVTLRFI